MTKEEALDTIREIDETLINSTDCSIDLYESVCPKIASIRRFIKQLPDMTQCKECAKYNPSLKFCNYWDCKMHENAHCKYGEKRKDGQ